MLGAGPLPVAWAPSPQPTVASWCGQEQVVALHPCSHTVPGSLGSRLSFRMRPSLKVSKMENHQSGGLWAHSPIRSAQQLLGDSS